MLKKWLTETSRKSLSVAILVLGLVIVGIPTAIWFGAASAIFDSPGGGIITFFVVLGIAVLLLIGEFISEEFKERRKSRQRR